MHKAILYQRVSQIANQMKGCLASGYPFVFPGFPVYASFMSAAVAKTGHASMPKPNEQLEGGHAVLAVGYDDANQWFIVRNSWGTEWGIKGDFTLPDAVPARPESCGRFLDDQGGEVNGACSEAGKNIRSNGIVENWIETPPAWSWLAGFYVWLNVAFPLAIKTLNTVCRCKGKSDHRLKLNGGFDP